MPATAGFTYSVYLGTSASPTALATSASGPTVGPLAGMATQLAPSSVVILTGIGVTQVPPAAPATGVTVYPSFLFGQGAYGQVLLDNIKFVYLKEADKSDKLNQLRIVGWKMFHGFMILNQQFLARIESTSAFTSSFG